MTDTTTPKKRGSIAGKFALIVALVLVIALVIFILQNTVHTTIDFIGWNFDVPQGALLLGAAVVGAVIAFAISGALRVRRAVR